MSEVYLPTAIYEKLVATLVAVEHDPLGKGHRVDQIKEALGEIGGIWPASVLDDPARVEIDLAA